MTTSAKNLDNMKDVIDEYVRLGFKGIFLRSLNPYGFAAEKKNELGYDIEKFVDKYFEALSYLIEINKKVYFQEYFTSLLLARILTPFSTGFVDLQSPAGVGISGVIYDYDGSVFPADEARMLARMGDRHFCLGNVYTDSYDSIFLEISSGKINMNQPSKVFVFESVCWNPWISLTFRFGVLLR